MNPLATLGGALGVALLSAGCATTVGAVPNPFPMPDRAVVRPRPPVVVASNVVTSRAGTYALVSTALQLRGAPYRNGGSDPFGFDCSGYTQYVFAQHQVALPREARDQFAAGQAVDLEDLAPGDLLFFSTTEPGASHVAIAVGSGEFVHAPSSTGVVRVERLSTPYWSERYLGARRVVQP